MHLKEVEAGLYSLPWQEAADERAALEIAVPQAKVQQGVPEEMMRAGATGQKYSAVLSDARMQAYVKDTAFVARFTANDKKDEVEQRTLSTATDRSRVEFATWLESLASATANVAQLSAKLSSVQRKELYLRKDEGFRTQRAAISRQLAWLQISEHCRQDSALNYDQRLQKQKALFDVNLQCLIQRVVVLAQGLKENYSIDIPLDPPRTGNILDDVSVWLVKAQNELSKYKRAQRVVICSKWNDNALNVTPRGKGSGQLDTFKIDLVVDKTNLPGGKALLRGVAFEYVGEQKRPISLRVLPPQNAWLGNQSDPLFFGRVCPIAPDLDLKPQYPDVFWNGSALGTWKVEGAFDQTAGAIHNLVMHIWLSAL